MISLQYLKKATYFQRLKLLYFQAKNQVNLAFSKASGELMSNYNKQISTINNKDRIHKTYEHNGYIIEISTTQPIESLKTIWLQLETKNSVPFFLTWHWISCWIKTYNPNLICISASFQNKIVAIGLFTNSLEKRHKIIHSEQLRLHQMGNILMDQIWMEYNDFICEKEHQIDAVNACLHILQLKEIFWDEIIISMMSHSRAENITASQAFSKIEYYKPAYAVNLSEIRNSGQEYLQLLTKNTRYQVRRSIRLYEKKYGVLKLSQAKHKEEALEFFLEAGKLHVQRWEDSGFKNKEFIQFHKNLILDSFEDNTINLLKLTANKETIAIMYYHLIAGTVYFYLHGLNYEDDKKLKPGLVAHALATEFYIQQGMDKYDYMGGYSQYKIQLASRTEDLATVIIQRPRPRFKLEKVASAIKNWIIPKIKKNNQIN